MNRKARNISFKTFEEYSKHYSLRTETKADKTKSKYYNIGASIAKMACNISTSKLNKSKNSSFD